MCSGKVYVIACQERVDEYFIECHRGCIKTKNYRSHGHLVRRWNGPGSVHLGGEPELDELRIDVAAV